MSLRSEVVAILNAVTGPLSEKSWSDRAPTDTPPPYTIYLDAISTVPSLAGDGRTRVLEQLFQVDLWERSADEDGTLIDQVWAALDGRVVQASTTRLRCRSFNRLPDPDRSLAHHALTVAAQRIAPS